jgi:hypothetical protein
MGSDTYSPAIVQYDASPAVNFFPLHRDIVLRIIELTSLTRKRFLVLQEMSAAVMEDRQDRNAEVYPYEAGTENDDVVYISETTSRTAASINNKLPARPPTQSSDHSRIQFALTKTNAPSFTPQRASHNRSRSDEYSPPPPSNRTNSNHGERVRHGNGAKIVNSPPRKTLRSDEWLDKSPSPRPVQRRPEERRMGMTWGSEVYGKRRHSDKRHLRRRAT